MSGKLEKVKWCDAKMAAKVSALGFPDGGYRKCSPCGKAMKVTTKQIAEWVEHGMPPCKICKGRTELITNEELERMRTAGRTLKES